MKIEDSEVEQRKFSDLHILARFFALEDLTPYTKMGNFTCIDDYSQSLICVPEGLIVWVKSK